MSSSQDASSHARVISRSMRKSNAFSTSGRLSLIVARGGAFSYTIDSKPSSSGGRGRGCVGSVNVREHHGELATQLHRVLAGRHELVAAGRRLERLHVGPLELGVVAVRRLAHRRAEDLAVTEGPARIPPAPLDVLFVPIRVRLSVVQDDRANHFASPSS